MDDQDIFPDDEVPNDEVPNEEPLPEDEDTSNDEERDKTELDDELIDTDSIEAPELPEPNEDGVVVAQVSENGPPTSAVTDVLDEPTHLPPSSIQPPIAQSVDGLWPKNIPEGQQVNQFTGELEPAPDQELSPSPLEQRLVAMGSTAYREGDKGGLGDQFTTTQNFGTHAEKQSTNEGVELSSGVTEPVRDEHTGPIADVDAPAGEPRPEAEDGTVALQTNEINEDDDDDGVSV